MATDKMNWIDEREKATEIDKSKDYFNLKEGDNRFLLLTHCAPFAQKWTGSTYVPAAMDDENVSYRGVCWILQEDQIKLAKLPYTVVKHIRALMNDPDYAFEEFPMNRAINVKAVGAGTKEVEYSVIPSPKEYTVSEKVMSELMKKPTPEEMIAKMKEKAATRYTAPVEIPVEETGDITLDSVIERKGYDYPKDEVDVDKAPF